MAWIPSDANSPARLSGHGDGRFRPTLLRLRAHMGLSVIPRLAGTLLDPTSCRRIAECCAVHADAQGLSRDAKARILGELAPPRDDRQE